MTIFDKVRIVCKAVILATLLVIFVSFVADTVNAQTVTVNIPDYGMHDSVHEIMEVSNPMCYIDGRITKVRVDQDCHECIDLSYLQMVDIVITPQYYIWEDTCSQFQHNHFTDYEVPELHKWHMGTWVRVSYLHEGDIWSIYDVSPSLAEPLVSGR